MAEVAKFRKSEDLLTGWDAAKQSFRQGPAGGVVDAATNTVANVLRVPGTIAQSGFRAGQNFDFAAGSGGGIMPPAAMAEAERVRQDLNPNGLGILTNALPKVVDAAIEVPQNFTAAANGQPTYPEAQGFRPAPVAMLPSHGPAFTVAPTAGNVEDPRAENYGRGITEIINAPGQQGRSFTNLIPAGAPVTGITEMTQRFREQPQGVTSDSGEVLLGANGRGSFRTEAMTPAPATATAPPASLRQPKTIEDYLSGVRTSGGPGDLVAMGLASRLAATDTALANRDENLAARGIRQAQTDRKLGIEEANAETARGTMRVAQSKALAELAKLETMKKVRFAPPTPDPNGIPTKDAAGNVTYPMLPAKVTLGDTEFDVSATDYDYARENANRYAALQLKKNPNVDPETLMNESLQVALADVIRLRNQE